MLVVYELNEVPPRLLEHYAELKPHSAIAKIVRQHIYRVTYTRDDIDGELHPWSTWPTVHRGVPRCNHKITYINQDLREANRVYPPVWESLRRAGFPIGIFGSLQSYPLPSSMENVRFYVPDTFAPRSDAFPYEGHCFQRFNLELAGRNKATAGSYKLNDLRLLVMTVWGGGIDIKGIMECITQLFRESLQRKWARRRPFLQAVLGFELYFRMLKREKVVYSSFFTNHVAGAMHRYWRDLFPQDFADSEKIRQIDSFNKNTILRAMDIADGHVGRLMAQCAKQNADLWVISSMGQSAIDRGEYVAETVLVNSRRLFRRLGLQGSDYTVLPAMQPDVCIKSRSSEDQDILRERLRLVMDTTGERILTEKYPPNGLTLNISLRTSKWLAKDGLLMVEGKIYSAREIGLEIVERDQGTGYHVREGIFLAAGPNEQLFRDDHVIDTTVFYTKALQICQPSVADLCEGNNG